MVWLEIHKKMPTRGEAGCLPAGGGCGRGPCAVRCWSRLFVSSFLSLYGVWLVLLWVAALLAAWAWCFAGQCATTRLCGGTECCGALCSGGLGVAFGGGVVAWLGSCVRGLAWDGPGASGGWTARFFVRVKIPTQLLPFPSLLVDLSFLFCILIEKCECHRQWELDDAVSFPLLMA